MANANLFCNYFGSLEIRGSRAACGDAKRPPCIVYSLLLPYRQHADKRARPGPAPCTLSKTQRMKEVTVGWRGCWVHIQQLSTVLEKAGKRWGKKSRKTFKLPTKAESPFICVRITCVVHSARTFENLPHSLQNICRFVRACTEQTLQEHSAAVDQSKKKSINI